MTIKDVDFLDHGQGFHLHYSGYVVGVGLDSSLSGNIPEEFAGSYPECTLLEVKLHIELSEESKCFLQVL